MSGTAVPPTGAARSRRAPARRLPAVLAVALVVLGVLAVAVRLDAPADGARVTAWLTGGVVISTDIAASAEEGSRPGPGLVTGDVVRVIGGHALTERPGTLTEPALGTTLTYEVERADRVVAVAVEIARPAIAPMLRYGWGDLVFVIALALLAVALYVRRPEEPATAPLLVVAGGLLGSTLAVVAGVPPLAMATGGPVLWLYNFNTIGAYAVAWGALPVFALLLPGDRRVSRPALVGSAAAAPLATAVVVVLAGLRADDRMGWLADVTVGTSAVVAATLLVCGILGVLAYLRSDSPDARARHLWVGGGTVLTVVLGLVGWHLPHLALGHSLLPAGALGLSALPFIVGVGVALRRHRLFDIERLANRSLTYLGVTAVLVAGYAILVALLGKVLGLSGGVAAALAAAVAAVALAPLLRLTRQGVRRLMYGDRDDPAGVLARLGSRMQAVMLPDDVLPVVVETVASSLRLPHVAIDLVDPPTAVGDELADPPTAVGDELAGDGQAFRTVAEHGSPGAHQHCEPLTHHGTTVGRLRVSHRGPDDPLDGADLSLLAALVVEIGPAVQAVRLHQDLLRSRAEVVALREDERRRLRRDLHDGLGPALAAIGLKAGLARREVADSSTAYALLGEIDTEVKAGLGGIRRLVEGLRPPALDELGLVGALRSRAASLAGELDVVVDGAVPDGLPAAVETAAYRIAVEAMTNAARHSAGSHCSVEVGAIRGELVVEVSDDGAGMDPVRRPGVGLRSMRERAGELGGTLSTGPGASGSGTVVTARLPLMLGERMVTLILADDHPVFSAGLRAVFDAEADFEVLAVVGTGRAAVEAAVAHRPEVAVLDIAMPDGDGLSVCAELRTRGVATRALMLTMYDDDENVLAALRAGAYGYTLKGAGPDELVAAVRAVARGEALFGAGIAARMLDVFGRSASVSPFPQLTEREAEVLGLLATGLDNAVVARRLGVSSKTVRNHVSNIITKLHVADRSAAILRARDAGLGGAG